MPFIRNWRRRPSQLSSNPPHPVYPNHPPPSYDEVLATTVQPSSSSASSTHNEELPTYTRQQPTTLPSGTSSSSVSASESFTEDLQRAIAYTAHRSSSSVSNGITSVSLTEPRSRPFLDLPPELSQELSRELFPEAHLPLPPESPQTEPSIPLPIEDETFHEHVRQLLSLSPDQDYNISVFRDNEGLPAELSGSLFSLPSANTESISSFPVLDPRFHQQARDILGLSPEFPYVISVALDEEAHSDVIEHPSPLEETSPQQDLVLQESFEEPDHFQGPDLQESFEEPERLQEPTAPSSLTEYSASSLNASLHTLLPEQEHSHSSASSERNSQEVSLQAPSLLSHSSQVPSESSNQEPVSFLQTEAPLATADTDLTFSGDLIDLDSESPQLPTTLPEQDILINSALIADQLDMLDNTSHRLSAITPITSTDSENLLDLDIEPNYQPTEQPHFNKMQASIRAQLQLDQLQRDLMDFPRISSSQDPRFQDPISFFDTGHPHYYGRTRQLPTPPPPSVPQTPIMQQTPMLQSPVRLQSPQLRDPRLGPTSPPLPSVSPPSRPPSSRQPSFQAPSLPRSQRSISNFHSEMLQSPIHPPSQTGSQASMSRASSSQVSTSSLPTPRSVASSTSPNVLPGPSVTESPETSSSSVHGSPGTVTRTSTNRSTGSGSKFSRARKLSKKEEKKQLEQLKILTTQPEIHITLDETNSFCDLGDTISGCARYKPTFDKPVRAVSFALIMSETVTSGKHVLTHEVPLDQHDFSSDHAPICGFALANTEYEFNFVLKIPLVLHDRELLPLQQRLPPSYQAPDYGVDISYYIRAIVDHQNPTPPLTEAASYQSTSYTEYKYHIMLSPSYAPPEFDSRSITSQRRPSQTENRETVFTHIYKASGTILERGLLRNKVEFGIVELHVLGLQTVSLEVDSDVEDAAKASPAIQINVLFFPVPGIKKVTLPYIHKMTADLHIKTFVASGSNGERLKSYPEAGSPGSTLKTQTVRVCDNIISKSGWLKLPTPPQLKKEVVLYGASHSIPLSSLTNAADENLNLIPTYLGCYSCREYEMTISVTFNPTRVVTLKVPVAITASNPPKTHLPFPAY